MAKVLLVEDDNNLREIYEARLQAEGYQIATARDGEEALVVAKQEHPDLVISDVMMPKISGFEMLDILRNTDGLQAVKVIMLTALGQNDDQQRANQLGADRYLVKSQVTLEDIVRAAHELLGDAPAATPPAADSAAPTVTADAPVTEPPADPAVAATDEPNDSPETPAAEPPMPTPAEGNPLNSPDNDSTGSVAPESPVEAAAEAVSDAESTASETADVDAKIEDFVSGASSDAPAPEGAVSPEPTPEPPTESPQTPAAETPPRSAAPIMAQPGEPTETTNVETPTTAGAASDEKLLADAVNRLVKSSAEPTAETTPEPTTAPTLPAETTPEPPKGGGTGGQKVIQPIADADKKDLATLVAEEDAKQSATNPPAGTVVVSDVSAPTKPAKPSTPPPEAPVSNDPSDPSNIAL